MQRYWCQDKQIRLQISECFCKDIAKKKRICCKESWVPHYKQLSIGQRVKWKRPTFVKTKSLKSQASAYNVMLPLFRDCNGPILEHYLDQSATVTATSYNEILKSKLKLVNCKKRTDFLSKWVLLLHDNDRPHSTAATVEATKKAVFKLLPRTPPTPHSPIFRT